ncbi:MAG: hypothetical protein IRZ20_00130 [Thermoleophilia bacterium]|nr:hypothetical protein [Thermoleophilia bacterium]
MLALDVRDGEVDESDVGGCKMTPTAHTPKAQTDGSRRPGRFSDEKSAGEQLDELVQVDAARPLSR